MKSRRNALWIALIISLASGLALPHSARGQEIPTNLLQQDFQIMRHTLEEADGGLYRHTSKLDMDRTFDRAYGEIDHPMTAIEFWALVAPVVAHIKDSHLLVCWPKDFPLDHIPLLPLSVRVFGGRLFVYRDFSNDDRTLEGSEILSINGIPAKQITGKMMTSYNGEGNSTTAAPYRIGYYNWFRRTLYGLMKIESPFRITYRNSGGEEKGVTMVGKSLSDISAASGARDSQPTTTADLKFLDGGKIAVLTIRHFYQYVDAKQKLMLHDFLQESFAKIHRKGSSALIIDLRGDSGGLDAPGAQLFSYLWDKPFEYYRDMVVNAREFDFFKYCPGAKPIPADVVEKRRGGKFHYLNHPGLGLQQPCQPHFGGKVLALMNGGTDSTSCEFLSMLKLHERGTLIGEEAAGSYYGCQAGPFVVDLTLPNSKVWLPINLTTYYYVASDYKYADRGMIPDYPVAHTIGDLLAGRDRDMDMALSLTGTK
jgi:hypothetical protein